MTKDSPLTVAGAAAALERTLSAPHSLLIPQEGNRHDYLELRRAKSQCHRSAASPRASWVRILFAGPLVRGLNHCMSIGRARKLPCPGIMDEHSERHDEGRCGFSLVRR